MVSICFLGCTALAKDLAVSANDRHPLMSQIGIPTYVWSKPESNPQAIIVGFHGGCLHGRAFQPLAARLVKHDWMFVSFDMRGYGKWHHCQFGTAGDRTFNYRRTLGDVRMLLTKLRSSYPGVPIYCLGESLGANAAVIVATEMSDLSEGVVLVSPAFGPKLFISPKLVCDIAHAIVKPKSPLDMSPYFKKRLASDPNVVLEYFKDPMRRDLQTPKELWQSLALNYRGLKYTKQLSPRIAVLVIHGKEDKLCSVNATKRVFKHIPVPDKQLVLLHKTGHLIVESSQIDENVVATITRWIASEVGMQAAMKQNHRLPRQTYSRVIPPRSEGMRK